MMGINPLRKSFAQFFILLLLAGCTVGPDFETPEAPNVDSYTEEVLPDKTVEMEGEGGEVQHFIEGKDIPACWWYLFHSEPLNQLIERAIKNNPTLKVAEAAFREGEADLQVSLSSIYPFANIQAAPERQKFNPAIFGFQAPPRTFNLYNTGANVSYTLDLFGTIRRQIEASEAQLNYQRFQVEATYLTLTTNVVTSAITEAAIRNQIQATHELIASQEKILEITQKKFLLGGVSQLEVLAQKTLLAQTRATLPPLEISLAKIRHALAILVGCFPSEASIPYFDLSTLKLPNELPISLPSELVCQRPDIRASEELLHAATARVGIATANLLPQVTLTANYGWLSDHFETLFTKGSTVWTLIGNILQPVFQGGALIAKRQGAIAILEQAAAQYKQTVLQAFQNVADTLKALEIDAHQLQIQQEAESAARQTLTLTERQYKLGVVSYISLLDAESQYQQARIARIQAEALRFADTAALFQALGGGWWNRPLPVEHVSKEEDDETCQRQ